MERRKFLQKSASIFGLGVLSASAFIEACSKQQAATSSDPQGPAANFTIDLNQSANQELKKSGGSVTSHGVVVANTGNGYSAVAEKCTHNGCSVQYISANTDFECPCHGGRYDLKGNVISGPPPSPLKNYKVTENNNILTVAG